MLGAAAFSVMVRMYSFVTEFPVFLSNIVIMEANEMKCRYLIEWFKELSFVIKRSPVVSRSNLPTTANRVPAKKKIICNNFFEIYYLQWRTFSQCTASLFAWMARHAHPK